MSPCPSGREVVVCASLGVSGWLGERVWARVILFFGRTLQLAGSSLPPLGVEPAAWAVRTIALIAGPRGEFPVQDYFIILGVPPGVKAGVLQEWGIWEARHALWGGQRLPRSPGCDLGFLGSLQRGRDHLPPKHQPRRASGLGGAARWVALAAHAPRSRRLREGRPASRRARGFGGAGAAWEAGCGLKGRLAWVTAPRLALGMGRQCQAVNVQVGQVIAAVPARTCRCRLGVLRAEQSSARAPEGAVDPRGRVESVRPGALAARSPRETRARGGQVRARSVRPVRSPCRSP